MNKTQNVGRATKGCSALSLPTDVAEREGLNSTFRSALLTCPGPSTAGAFSVPDMARAPMIAGAMRFLATLLGMPSSNFVWDPDHWRLRAEGSPESKRQLRVASATEWVTELPL